MKAVNKSEEYHRMFVLLKVSQGIIVVLTVVVIALIILIASLFPLKKNIPFFVELRDKTQQVVRVEPIEANTKGEEILKIQYIKNYVIDRETIDLQTDSQRWEKLDYFHTEDVRSEFVRLTTTDNQDSPLVRFSSRKITREVKIISCHDLAPEAPNTYRLEWKSYDRNLAGEIIQVQENISKLTIDLYEQIVTEEDKEINPIGIYVVSYKAYKNKEKVK